MTKKTKPAKKTKKIPVSNSESFYCSHCGGCGFIGCDGVKDFLEKHVRDNTDCKQEGLFIDQIIELFEQYKIDHDL